MLNFYICVSYIFHFFANIFLNIRVLKKKEHPTRFKEKLGFYEIKNNNPTIWFHASSLGEIKSVVPLIFHFSKNKNYKILITTVTLSSSEYCRKIFEHTENITHQFAPLDTPIIVKKFLDHWKPQMSIFVESEIWPNLILQTKKVSKLILLNARLSNKSFSRWKLVKKFAQKLFKQFDSITAQSREVKSFLEFFGIQNVYFLGNLKFISPDNVSNNDSFVFRKVVENSWVAMSIHKGEETFIIETVKKIKKEQIESQCILIPRHLNKIKELTDTIKANNLTYQLKSKETLPLVNKDFYILDSFGDAGKVFEKINLVFLGGSIIAHGGQNPLEPAREGCYLLHGPNIYNFTEIFEFLAKNNVSKLVTSEITLSQELISNFQNFRNNDKLKAKMKEHSKKILLDHINYLNSFIK
jgi:3-deoxy-D-manno-octulosonic-acid transferase